MGRYIRSFLKDKKGAATVENAVLWGIVGILVISAGWASYGSLRESAQTTSDDSVRRESLGAATQTQRRQVIDSPNVPQYSSDSGNDIVNFDPPPPDESSNNSGNGNSGNGNSGNGNPSSEPSGAPSGETFLVEEREGESNDRYSYRITGGSRLEDYKSLMYSGCTSTPPSGDQSLTAVYTGNDYQTSKEKNCMFTRAIYYWNGASMEMLVTTAMKEDVNSDEFAAHYYPDQVIQWESSLKPDPCTTLECISTSRDPARDPACYSITGEFSPSLCGAAPVLNGAGQTILWRKPFTTQGLDWRKTINAYDEGILEVSETGRWLVSEPGGADHVPDFLSTTDYDLSRYRISTSNLNVEPGCPDSQKEADGSWSESCSPKLMESQYSDQLDGYA